VAPCQTISLLSASGSLLGIPGSSSSVSCLLPLLGTVPWILILLRFPSSVPSLLSHLESLLPSSLTPVSLIILLSTLPGKGTKVQRSYKQQMAGEAFESRFASSVHASHAKKCGFYHPGTEEYCGRNVLRITYKSAPFLLRIT
jgi:hypothetical protein